MTLAVVAQGLTKHFGGVPALDGLSFEVGDRDILCIVGPNGAGKSTLFRVLAGVMKPDSGEAFILGANIKKMSSRGIARLGVATKFQVPRVFGTLSVADHIALASRVGMTIPQLLGLKSSEADGGGSLGMELLERMGLGHLTNKLAGELGHGERQWLEIVMTLATNPRLLLLDEPGAGMSPEEKSRTADLILQLAGSMTILVIEHDLDLVRHIARNVLVMHRGALLTYGTFAEISTHPDVRRVYLGSGDESA